MKYRGWTIEPAYYGYVGTHDRLHDESGRWQVNGATVEECQSDIDVIEDDEVEGA